MCTSSLLAQDPCYWQITDEMGLPSMTVYQIHEDREGYIWLGTENGLCRFDGKEFKYYDNPQLNDSEILKITEDNDGKIWFCNLNGQLASVQNDEIVVHEINISQSAISIVNNFIIDKNNLFWFQGKIKEAGVFKAKIFKYSHTDSTQNYTFKYHLSSDFLTPHPSKDFIYANLIYNSQQRFYGKINVNTNEITTLDSTTAQLKKCVTTQIHDESIFISSANSSNACVFDEKTKEIQSYFKTKRGDIINFYHIDNHLFVLTKSGLFILNQENKTIQRELFKGKAISNIIKDKQNNYWVTTLGDGVFFIRNLATEHYSNLNSNLTDNNIFSLFKHEANNELLIGTKDNHINRLNLKTKQVSTFPLEISGRITIIKQLKDEFIVGGDAGLLKIGLTTKSSIKKFKSAVKNIYQDDYDRTWLGLSNATIVIGRDYFESDLDFTPNLERRKEKVLLQSYAITEDTSKKFFWLGTNQGLYKAFINEGDFKGKIFEENGVENSSGVSSLALGSDNTLWVATTKNGVIGIKNDRQHTHLNKDNVLKSNVCKKIIATDQELWIATNKGLHKYNFESKKCQLIDSYDHLPSNDINTFSLIDSTIWIGTSKGLVKYPLSIDIDNKDVPLIRISSLAINQEDRALSQKYELNYNEKNLKIDFEGLCYKSKNALQYKYQMLGLDSTWISTDSRFVRFQGLAPGEYTFKVLAVNEDHLESTEAASIQFYIARSWWTTWWFYSLMGLLLLAIIWFFVQRKWAKDKAQQDLENKVHQLQLMALQTQMNPHFIFNALNAIQQYVATRDTKEALTQISKFAKLIREIFEQSKNSYINLDDEIEFLKLYLDFEKLRFEDKVRIHFTVTEEVKEMGNQYKLPPLLIQPLVENAFKHGLFHKEGGGDLWINFKLEDELIYCSIEDNGVGREQALQYAKSRQFTSQAANINHQSSGIKTTQERLNILNATNGRQNRSIKIIDLKDDNNKPSGTKVIIKV